MGHAAIRPLLALSACALLTAGVWFEPGQETEPAAEPAKAADREPLRLVYLANEGFMVEVGDQRALFDAFVGVPYAGYPAMTKELVAKLEKAEAPFDDIAIALTSHAHGDHFQQKVALAFLESSPNTPFVGTPQAQKALQQVAGDDDALKGRLHGVYPKLGEESDLTFGEGDDELRVRHLRIPHGGAPKVENYGSLLTIGGHTVLHLGDADVDPKIFAPYEDELKDVDVALVPYWFYATKKGRSIVEKYLPAKTHVAMHFAKRDHAAVVKSFLENHEGVHAFADALDEAEFD